VLLIGAHAFVWLLPLLAFSLLRVYDVYLLRQTEHQLIAESVVVRELYREALVAALGGTRSSGRVPDLAERSLDYDAPAQDGAERYRPIDAQVDFAHPVLSRDQGQLPLKSASSGPADRAGANIEPLLRRAQRFNLSALRVLDPQGCVVATTGSEARSCMASLPEVQRALSGSYAAVLRERVSDEPPPKLGDIRRRGKVRVFTALPIWLDGRVVGVVRASRTGLDALSSLWANRRGLVWLSSIGMVLVLAVSVLFSRAIARPLRNLTFAAHRVAAGGSPRQLALTATVPREIALLHDVLFQMATKLSQRASYVQEFASQVSHELKSPITAIRGAAELLAHGLDDMPRADQERFAANVLEDAQRMEQLVSKLLMLARAENQSSDDAAPMIDVGAHVAELLARYEGRVELQLAEQPLRAAIEPDRLASMVSNLVENGLRHGAGEPVRVVLASEAPHVRLDVVDRGPGVSEANRKRLFERFFTTERDRGGTGLGLAIVKGIAEGRGGRVGARFDAEGSTFSVWF
jgi:signal transduction histidine kinase